MLIEIDIEEWWPVYEISKTGRQLDLPEEKIEWLKQLFEDFEKGQQYLREEWTKIYGRL